jgi:UDP-GlcNAc3NAcA epimerase
MKKVLTVLGARPQFIKASVVSEAFSTVSSIQEVILHTGQHYDENMSSIFFEQMGIPKPTFYLGIGSGSHGEQTAKMLTQIEQVLVDHNFSALLVYGDTNSTLAGALAATKLHIPVVHVEAGLRSFDKLMPEEINRVLTDHVSDLLFAPTFNAIENLKHEGIYGHKVMFSGDVMYDVAIKNSKKADDSSKILKELQLIPQNYILATIHRAENTDNPKRLNAIIEAFEHYKQFKIVFPLHPRTANVLSKLNWLERLKEAVCVIDPVGFLDMISLEKNSKLIITDSGGIQKEAFFFSVPCVTLRDQTEWVELVQLGWNHLQSPTSSTDILTTIDKALNRIGQTDFPYGQGNAADYIVRQIGDFL